MRVQAQLRRASRWLVGGVALVGILTGTALAGPYTHLQVLLPGESPAPGTSYGKTGIPHSQVAGVPFPVRVRACDNQWLTVASATNDIRIQCTDSSADLPGVTALLGGEMILTVTLHGSGAFRFTVQDMSDATIPLGNSNHVALVELEGFRFENIQQLDQTAGVSFATSLMAIDALGNIVLGYDGPVDLQQLTGQGVGRIEPAVVQLVDGMWGGPLTVYRADETDMIAGSVSLYAVLARDPGRNGSSNAFVVHPGPLTRVQIVLPGQMPLPGSVTGLTGTPASQGASESFEVDLFTTDAYWNPLPSSHEVRITSSDSWGTTPLTTTLHDGTATAAVGLATSGDQTLTVYDLTDPTVQGMISQTISVAPNAASHFAVETLPGQSVAGEPVTVTIRATDGGGGTLTTFNGDASLVASSGPGTIAPESITFSAGVWTGELTFYGAGDAVQFTCTDYASPPHLGDSSEIAVAPAAYSALQVVLPGQTVVPGTTHGITGDPLPQHAGQPFDIQVRAVDAWYNRVDGIDDEPQLSASDANLGAPAQVTLHNGAAMVPVTVFAAGTQFLTVAANGDPDIVVGRSADCQVIAGPFDKLLVTAPGESPFPGSSSGREGTADEQSITYQFDLTVWATDAWWNPVTGVTDVVRFSSTDPLAELPGDTPLQDGRADVGVRLATGGYQQITATNITRSSIPANTTQVEAISSGLHLEASIAEAAVQAGAPFLLSVRVTNDAGSVIQEVNSSVNIVARHATTQEEGSGELEITSFQLLQGERTIALSYTRAEPIVLEITGGDGAAPALTGAIEVVPAAPAQLTLTCDPTWVRANRTAQVRAVVMDVYGNGIPAEPVLFVTSAADNGSLGEAGQKHVTVATDAAGLATTTYHSPRLAQTVLITAASSSLSAELNLQTALVDPFAAGGTLTSYPNPFHPDDAPTTIAYVLDTDAAVRLRIFTLTGGLVLDRTHPAGDDGGQAGLNEVAWDGRNGDGEPVASGGYVLHVEAEGNGSTQHVMRRKVGVVW